MGDAMDVCILPMYVTTEMREAWSMLTSCNVDSLSRIVHQLWPHMQVRCEVSHACSYRLGVCVPGEKLDPRAAVAGRALNLTTPGGELWQSGLFDRGSWTEAQAGWARRLVFRPFVWALQG